MIKSAVKREERNQIATWIKNENMKQLVVTMRDTKIIMPAQVGGNETFTTMIALNPNLFKYYDSGVSGTVPQLQ
jgi:hypothetical protein